MGPGYESAVVDAVDVGARQGLHPLGQKPLGGGGQGGVAVVAVVVVDQPGPLAAAARTLRRGGTGRIEALGACQAQGGGRG